MCVPPCWRKAAAASVFRDTSYDGHRCVCTKNMRLCRWWAWLNYGVEIVKCSRVATMVKE